MNNFNTTSLWTDILKKLEIDIGAGTVELWLKPITPLFFENNILKLEAPDLIFCETMRTRYESKILPILKELTGTDVTIEYTVSISSQLPLKRPALPSEIKKEHFKKDQTAGTLNPNYTFESFVVGPSNRFAHAAAEGVARNNAILSDLVKKPAHPFFLYSPSGLGKTHLLHAIGNYILRHNETAKVLYAHCEEFVNEYIGAIQHQNTESFRNKYRRLDCLLLDDVQFLIGKARSEEEFFYTFNTLFDQKKQIVISSDRTPKELSLGDQRLISRFLSGMVADIKTPDLETRVAILRKKKELHGYQIPDDVIYFIAENVKKSIRELEGSLIRIDGFCSSHGIQATIDEAKEILKDVISGQDQDSETSIEVIKKVVADKYSLDPHELKSQRRTDAISFPRQIAMYLACKMTNMSLSAVGDAFSKDHTTVIHARKKIEELLHSDPFFSETVNNLITKIKAVESVNEK